MQFFVIITIGIPASDGMRQFTYTDVVDVTTNGPILRQDLYEAVKAQVPREFAAGNVLFFSAEPNHIAV